MVVAICGVRWRGASLLRPIAAYGEARREHAEKVLERSVLRGDLPAQVDRGLALDLLLAPLYWRMIVRGVTPSRTELIVQSRAILAGLGAPSSDVTRR